MPERMTDAQLIELVQERLPEELTPAEIALLRERLHASPELQRTLIEQMHLEGYLAAALGEFTVSFDEILKRAGAAPKKPRSPLMILGISSAVVLLAVGLYFGLRGPGDTDAPIDPSVAQLEPNAAGSPEGSSRQAPSNPSTTATIAGSNTSDKPAASATNSPPPRQPWVSVREAEQFDRGNLQVDATNFGDGIGVVHSAEQIAGFVEYDFDVPADGLFQIELRYASDEPRPLRLQINGKPVRADAGRHDTGDWWPEGQRSFVEARVELPAGRATIQLQTDGLFPHIDKLAMAELDAAKSKATATATATDGLPLVALRPTAKPANVAATGGVKAPWEATLDPSKPPVPFAKAVFASFPLSDPQYVFSADELKQWVAPVAGKPLKLGEDAVGNRKFAHWEGIGKLQSPWPRDGVLRLSLFDIDRLRMHFWTGDEGASLQWFPKWEMWGAFRATRSAGSPTPAELTLAMTDDGRHARTELGVFELRHQNGTLVMTRGDLRLLTVPMPRPPKEVILEGKARVSGMALSRGEPAPALPANPRRTVVDPHQLADVKWVSQLLSPADMERSPDGTVALRTPALPKDKPPKLIWAAAPLDRNGLAEVIVKVSNAEPGTGVFLGDAQGHPIHHVGFFRDDQSKRTTFGYGWSTYGYEQPPEFRLRSGHDPDAEPVPYAGREQWLRLVLGNGGLKIWSSGDGVHWGRIVREPIRAARGTFGSVGLYAVTGEQPRQIQLDRLEVREFSGLTDLVDEPLRASLPRPAALDTIDYPMWLTALLKSRPRETPLPEWRRAYAVATLLQNPRPELASIVLRSLLADSIERPLPAEARWQAIEDAALIGDLWPGAAALPFTDFYARLAEQLALEGNANAFDRAGAAFAASSIWTEMKFTSPPPAVVRTGSLSLIHGRHWNEARAFAARTRHWLRNGHPDPKLQGLAIQKQQWADWTEAVAAHWQSGKPIGEPAGMSPSWRHPLVSQLSREGYNVLSELESALEGKSWEDACQLITATGTSGVLGLLPDARDPSLQVSMPRAIVLAMRDHPELQSTMREQYGKLGLLRVRQAVQEGQVDAIQAAAIQYFGTEAASEANRWLGDRAVASGRFARGIDYYRDALDTSTATTSADLQTRIRLAAALMGEKSGEPATTEIELGGAKLNAQSFEGLVTELQSARASQAGQRRGALGSESASDFAVPPLGNWEIATRHKLTGDVGQGAGSGAPGDVDWVARQLGVAVDGTMIYVNNRYHVAAFDSAARTWKWSVGLGGDQGHAHHWPLQSMQPLIVGDRLFVRRIQKNGPALACLDCATGKVIWNKRPDRNVASDPIFTRDKLFAVIASSPESGTIQFDMATFHPDTGDILSQEPLFRAKDVWGGQPPSGIAAASGRVVGSIGGCLVCCNLQGRPEWLRRSTWVPAAVEPSSYHQHAAAPRIVDDRIYHAQPGSHAVDCVELQTGRLAWSREIPELRRIVGIAAETVIARSGTQVLGLSRDDGLTKWSVRTESMLEAAACGNDGPILIGRSIDWDASVRAAALTWIDPEDGRELAGVALRDTFDASPKLGPLVMASGCWWTFCGKGNDPSRELVELKPTQGSSPLALRDSEWGPWLSTVPLRHFTESSVALPGWTPVAVAPASNTWLGEFRGEKNALLTRVEPGRPVSWVRRIAPAGGQPAKLTIRVGHQSGQSWTLVASAGPDELHRFTVDDKSAPNGWADVTIDLTSLQGRSEWLLLQAVSSEPPAPADAAWRNLP